MYSCVSLERHYCNFMWFCTNKTFGL